MGLDGEGGLEVGDEWSRFVFLPVPRLPADTFAFPAQLLADLGNALRDKRFVLVAVEVS